MPSLGIDFNQQNGNFDADHKKQMVQLAINLQHLQMTGYDAQELNPRRSQNVTESVRVPSSEHVAEIVGRQGCKIKSLRTKTNTYIKTPVRGEEPVFVVTGHSEDVNLAKAEILSTAEHFTKIRANRRNNGAPNSRPEDVTIKVPVLIRFVGLLVGSKGATIKNIQQKTDTYIITPSREKEPVFEVRGLPQNVLRAQELMYEHIYERTGLRMDDPFIQAGLRTDLENPFGFAPNSTLSLLAQTFQNGNNNGMASPKDLFPFSGIQDTAQINPGLFGSTGINSEIDEGIGGSPSYDNPTTPDSATSIWSPTDDTKSIHSILAANSLKMGSAPLPRRANSFGANSGFNNLPYSFENPSLQHDNMSTMSYNMSELSSAVSSVDSSPVFGNGPANLIQRKHCFVCLEKDIIPALIVPCGHSMFCYQCANQILNKVPDSERKCPVCQSKVEQLVQIRS